MNLGNRPQQQTTFCVEANKSFAFGLRFVKPDYTPYDLTGSTARIVLAAPTHLGSIEMLSMLAESSAPETGRTQVNFQAADLQLEAFEYPFDLTWVQANGYSLPVLKGTFDVQNNTDFDVTNDYTSVDVGSDFTVVVEHERVLRVIEERVVQW
jgi:hypothetical protein